MKKSITLMLLAALLLSGRAFSAPVWHKSEIRTIYPLGDGSFVIIFKEHSESCTNSGKYHYVRAGKNGVSSEGVKAMLAVALSAASMGKPININYENGESHCYINRLNVAF